MAKGVTVGCWMTALEAPVLLGMGCQLLVGGDGWVAGRFQNIGKHGHLRFKNPPNGAMTVVWERGDGGFPKESCRGPELTSD